MKTLNSYDTYHVCFSRLAIGFTFEVLCFFSHQAITFLFKTQFMDQTSNAVSPEKRKCRNQIYAIVM